MTKRCSNYFELKKLRKPIVIKGPLNELSLNEALEKIKKSQYKFRLSYLRRNPGTILKHTIIYES